MAQATPRQLRIVLTGTSVLFWLGALGAVYWAWRSPMPRVSRVAMAVRQRPTALPSSSLEVASLEPLLNKRLRRPLYDPPPPSKPTVAKTDRAKKNRQRRAAPPDVQLIGTVLEEGRSVAILMDRQGQIELKESGQTLQTVIPGAKVTQVTRNEVHLDYRGQSMILRMEEPNQP